MSVTPEELEALRKDAARYKWVRRSVYLSGYGWTFGASVKPMAGNCMHLSGQAKRDDIDAAVDAAMLAERTKP